MGAAQRSLLRAGGLAGRGDVDGAAVLRHRAGDEASGDRAGRGGQGQVPSAQHVCGIHE